MILKDVMPGVVETHPTPPANLPYQLKMFIPLFLIFVMYISVWALIGVSCTRSRYKLLKKCSLYATYLPEIAGGYPNITCVCQLHTQYVLLCIFLAHK